MNQPNRRRSYQAVVIGASAGGLQALAKLLNYLPPQFSLPVTICLHLQSSSNLNFEAAFGLQSGLRIKEAEEKEYLRPGMVYIAPSGYHLLIERDGSFSLANDAPVNWARPSIDVLFETAAEAYRQKLIGIVLTGANFDGASGLQSIRSEGGLTIVQDPSEAEVPSMPRAALAKGPIDHTLRLEEIGRLLGQLDNPDAKGLSL